MSVQPLESFTPYSTAQPMFTATPQWMSEYDAQRVMSYQVYEQIYWNVPDTFKITARGTDASPIYIPLAKTIINTTNRYVGKDWAPVIDTDYGTDADHKYLRKLVSQLFRRERFFSKYNASKRYGLIRGDEIIHIIGNDLKPAGTRLKIEYVDPAAYFPISHPDDPDRIIGAHIVEQIEVDGEWVLKRQTYQRGADPVGNDGSDTTIYNSIATFEADSWESFNAKPVNVIKPLTALHPDIKALPLYHIKNIETPGDPFGSSELRGLERIMGAVNQAVSDEELALALEGLGMYWTDSGPPQDEDGNDTDWMLGPGRVVEVPSGKKFNRLSGINSVDPVQSHLGFLIKMLKEAAETPDVAIGQVERHTAESGISLMLQMGPMLTKAEERDESRAGVMDQFLFDLTTQWLPAYEGESTDAIMVSSFGEKLPTNRAQEVQEILAMVREAVISAESGRMMLSRLGVVVPNDEGETIINEQAARAQAVDPFAARMGRETGDDLEPDADRG
jgi:hypothetical protein